MPDETHRLARRMLDSSFERALYRALAILGSKISLEVQQDKPAAEMVPADAKSKAAWEALPEAVREAVTEIVRGSAAARPYLHEAFDWNAIARQTGDGQAGRLGTDQVYRLAAGPWLAYGGGGRIVCGTEQFQGHAAGQRGRRILLLGASGHSQTAGCHAGRRHPEVRFVAAQDQCRHCTSIGTGEQHVSGVGRPVVDLGGDDRYSGRLAVPMSKSAPVGVLIDVAGNDTYDGRQSPASLACGLFGIGALLDLGGDDKYFCGDSGLGCAWHGIGLLVDTGGDDTYTGHQWCQGAAHAGVGMLIDEAGNDKYFCQVESQGLGSTLGVGVLIDKSGNDRYHAYDNENGRRITFPSSQTEVARNVARPGLRLRAASGQYGRSQHGRRRGGAVRRSRQRFVLRRRLQSGHGILVVDRHAGRLGW